LLKILTKHYPFFSWDLEKLKYPQKKSNQWWLYKLIKDLVPPNIEVFEDVTPKVINFSDSAECTRMILDVYVPSFQLAFEYQGAHHYRQHNFFGCAASYQKRDKAKQKACELLGITLLEVPYWWKRDKESVIAMLKRFRPDVIEAIQD